MSDDFSETTSFPETFRAAEANFLSWSVIDPTPALQARLGIGGAVGLQEATLSFYPGSKLIAVPRPGKAQDLFFLLAPETEAEVTWLNGTNEPIYAYNDEHGVTLTRTAQLDYIRFFFHFVRGQLGAFQIVEKPEDIAWCPGATEDIKAQLNALLVPPTCRGQHRGGLFRNTATVIFKNALFKTDIFVAPHRLEDVVLPGDDFPESYSAGQSALKNEELLMEGLPINGYC